MEQDTNLTMQHGEDNHHDSADNSTCCASMQHGEDNLQEELPAVSFDEFDVPTFEAWKEDVIG